MQSLDRRTNGHYNLSGDFAGLLRQHIQASLYSYGQLSQLSGVPKRTIVNWIDGTVRRPRHWQSVVRVAAALRQPRVQTDELLAAADLPTLQSLVFQADDPTDQTLLAQWGPTSPATSTQYPNCLFEYLRALTVELGHLPAYFPRQTAFTFAAIYQDLRLRRLESASPIDVTSGDVNHVMRMNEGEPWSVLRQKCHRVCHSGPTRDG